MLEIYSVIYFKTASKYLGEKEFDQFNKLVIEKSEQINP